MSYLPRAHAHVDVAAGALLHHHRDHQRGAAPTHRAPEAWLREEQSTHTLAIAWTSSTMRHGSMHNQGTKRVGNVLLNTMPGVHGEWRVLGAQLRPRPGAPDAVAFLQGEVMGMGLRGGL